MRRKILKEDLFQDLIKSIEEAKELGLNFDIFCEKCQRDIPNKKHLTSNGCLWCDPKGDKDG